MLFGERLRTHRQRRGITQDELALLTGVSARTIRNLESGRIGTARPSTARLLADALALHGAEHDHFLGEDETPRVPDAEQWGAWPTPAQLPADVAGFTGRTGHLRQLTGLLDADAMPAAVVITAISGTAGIGKTALAVHWAHQVRDRYPGGQLYVNLRGYDPDQPVTAAEALAQFLVALGVPGQELPLELEERAARYRSEVAERRMLIVLDNAATVDQVRPLLPGSGSCAVVVASRDSLAGLVAVHGARRLELDLLPAEDSVALLRRLIGPRVEAEPQAAAELADQCARLPLALRVAAELAVSRPDNPLSELVAELADQQQRLELMDAGGDHRAAVAAVFSWSLRHLPPDAAASFAVLGLHPGPDFDAYAAAALGDTGREQARRTLELLARAHLVRPTGRGRYDMHDLLRAYATGLATSPDTDLDPRKALHRLCDYYVATAAAAMDLLHPAEAHRRPHVPSPATSAPILTDPDTARAWLDTERPGLVAVAAHTASHGLPEHTVRLSTVLFRYLAGGHSTDALTIHEHARRAARQSGDRAGEAHALLGLGLAYTQLSRYEPALEHFVRARSLFRQTGDLVDEARALSNLGIVEARMERFEPAAGHQEEALAMFRQIGDRSGEARALGNLARVESQRGRFAPATRRYEQALPLFREADDRTGEATVLLNLGFMEQRQGHYESAIDRNLRALTVFRQLGDQRGEAWALENLGSAYHRLGRHDQVTEYHQQALALCRAAGDQVGVSQALNGLGEAAYATGNLQDALAHHTAALATATDAAARDQQARAHAGLGDVHRALGDPARARRHYDEALAIYADLGSPEADEVRARLADL